jgi:hypothetical protein
MSHEELRRYVLEVLPAVEQRNDRHVITKREIDQLIAMLRYAYRNVAYHGPGYDLLPQYGLAGAANTMHAHRHRGDTWKQATVAYHCEHGQAHFASHLAGDRSEPHLEHAARRALMACHLLNLASEQDAVD